MRLKNLSSLLYANWRSGLTVALISVPLSIALSIASGAGPIPGLITGVWATLIASIFGGSNFNIVGAAGALTTVLFSATLTAPLGLGPAVLPLLALISGLIILIVWALKADRFLYYIPSSVMYGFSAGVAFLIAASQLFDATGLSSLKRTGHFTGDIMLFFTHSAHVHLPTVVCFATFLTFILVWKKSRIGLPAVIPTSILGIIFGYLESHHFDQHLISLEDKFGTFSPSLIAPVPWESIPTLVMHSDLLLPLLKVGGIIALIAILETLITAKIGDTITKTHSSSTKELFGLALANIGSGAAGGLPGTGVFIRTGANIKAGATHKTSATIAAGATALIMLAVLPFFSYIPMAVIAALLVNTALGLIETEKFREFWMYEKTSFVIAFTVIGITVLEDAGAGVVAGALLALLTFANRVSHGRFDVILNFVDGTRTDVRGQTSLHIPHNKEINVLTYSIAGFLGYIDSERHAANFRHIANSKNVRHVIIRLRDLFALDFEGRSMLLEACTHLIQNNKTVTLTSAHESIITHLGGSDELRSKGISLFAKTRDALTTLSPS